MSVTMPRLALALVLCAAALGTGCTEVRGRKMIQDANELYRRGHYRDAVALYEEAQRLVPHLPVLWLNKGYTCRQLLTPGARTPENRQAAQCALGAFKKLQELAPKDPRGEQLYVQTLFEVDDFPTLEKLFLDRHRSSPADVDVIQGLGQVYYKQGRWPEALAWYRKGAEIRRKDAVAQYGVGTFIWQILSRHGGGIEMATFDPRPKPAENQAAPPRAPKKGARGGKAKAPPEPPPPPTPPPVGPNAIVGQARATLADEGIAYLERALAIRPRYPEAMSYLNLLYRQKSFAYFAEPAKWQAAVDKANGWQKRAAELGRAAEPKKISRGAGASIPAAGTP
jgi:tetratricopeptide (TPR) repeat protein